MRIISLLIIILLLLISGSIISYNYINSTSRNLVSQLEITEKAIENQKWTTAQEQIEQTQTKWHKTKYWWTILLNHHEIDNIDLISQRLEQYILTRNTTLSLAEISALEMLFEHISDTEAVNVENIL